MGDVYDLKLHRARGAGPGDGIANSRAEKCAGKGRGGGDAVLSRVRLILAHDLIGGFPAFGISDGDGQAEGNLGQVMSARVDHDGGLQARLKPADVTFGRGFGQLVQTFGPGAKGGKIALPRGKPGLQGGKAPRGDEIRTGGNRQIRQVRPVFARVFVDEGAAHFTITSSGS